MLHVHCLSSLTCYQYANKREEPKLSIVHSIISILPGEGDDFASNYRKSSEYADYNNLEYMTTHIIPLVQIRSIYMTLYWNINVYNSTTVEYLYNLSIKLHFTKSKTSIPFKRNSQRQRLKGSAANLDTCECRDRNAYQLTVVTNVETTFITGDRIGRNGTWNNRGFGETRLHCFLMRRHVWSTCCQFIICRNHKFDHLGDGILRSRRRKLYFLSKHRDSLQQYFWNWVPPRGVKDSERRKCVMATYDTNHSVTDSKQSVALAVQKLPDYVVKSASRARLRFDAS